MKNEEMINNRYLFSKWISYICEPPFLAIPTFIVLNLFLNMDDFPIIESICLLFGNIFPILTVLIWGKIKGVDRDYTIKETRNYPFLIATFLYFLATLILWLFSANPLTMAVMFCYGSNTLIVFFINLKWKISVHAMGITGPVTALMFINPWFFILGLLGPLVMWSRITLKKHTLGQVLAGLTLGYLITAIQLYYLINLMHFHLNVDLYLILLIITGLSLPPLVLSLKSYLNDKNDEGHTQRIFYFAVFGSFIMFLNFSSFIPLMALAITGIISIALGYFGGLDFPWLNHIKK